MKDLGFQTAGYEYVNSDDCWSQMSGRDAVTHQLLPNFTKFPEGIVGTANKVHDLGFKFGIYSSAGTMTCGHYPGSIGYENIDAETVASWGVDYLKYDNCFPPEEWYDDCLSCEPDPSFSPTGIINGTCSNSTPPVLHYSYTRPIPICADGRPVDGINYTAKYTALRFRIMGNALLAQNRTILYSLCEWGVDLPWTWGNGTGQSWRMSNDINPSWSRILQILNQNSFLSDYGDFYGHNDADMLEVGNGNLTDAEVRSHFSLWAMMKSPLLIGTDVTKLSAHNIGVLQNKALLAFNQDPVYGKPAAPYKWGINPDWTYNSSFPAQYWSGASSNGTMVALFNPLNNTVSMTADYSEIPELDAGGCYQVLDVWNSTGLGCKKDSVTVDVAPHDTAVLLFEHSCGGEQTRAKGTASKGWRSSSWTTKA
ncbi:alpha-galactosidase 1, partial [Aureobasidium melanogenum]